MTDEIQNTPKTGKMNLWVSIVLALAIVITAGVSLSKIGELNDKLAALQEKQKADNDTIKVLQDKLHMSDSQVQSSFAQLGEKLGLTQSDIQKRTEELRKQQSASDTKLTGLSAEQQKTAQQVAGVSSEVGNVKTELNGAKSDIGTAQKDISATRDQLGRMQGDMGQMSGLIAKNHDELEVLKHKGDRNYFEFRLPKGQKTNVGAISLELKKADVKHNNFTLEVYADDKVIEKKNRSLNEALQFYSGRERHLYEIVVYSVDKNTVTGYLSAPK